GVQPEAARDEYAAGCIGRDVLLEAEQQALPPARLRMKAGKFLGLRAHALPVGFRVDERAAVRVRAEHERLARGDQRVAVPRGNGEPALDVQREDSCAVERTAHLFSSPPLGFVKTQTAAFLSHFFLRFPTLIRKTRQGQAGQADFPSRDNHLAKLLETVSGFLLSLFIK